MKLSFFFRTATSGVSRQHFVLLPFAGSKPPRSASGEKPGSLSCELDSTEAIRQ